MAPARYVAQFSEPSTLPKVFLRVRWHWFAEPMFAVYNDASCELPGFTNLAPRNPNRG